MSDGNTIVSTWPSAVEAGSKKVGEQTAINALDGLKKFVKKKYGSAKVFLDIGFLRYLENAYVRYNKVRTLATGTEPRTIIGENDENDLYESMIVTHKNEKIDTDVVDSLLEVSHNLIIYGTGGLGKSMLMRYLFLTTADYGSYVPVLLNLRKISNQTKGKISVFDLIFDVMKDFDVELPEDQFEYSLRLGKYLFLLDGFDEIEEAKAKEAAKAIQFFCSKYPKNPCIITSRPTENTSPLETFTSVNLQPLNKKQAVSLASKIWEKSEKTEKLCQELDQELFDEHKDFAENPLLLSMMFLTYMHNGSIPNHLSDFYGSCFEVLYNTHDNHDKDIFRRDFACKELDEYMFKKIFAHFCFQSYFQEEYEFSKSAIKGFLADSISKQCTLPVNEEQYLKDLIDAVCMIIRDGNYVCFSHRSFQAYFAAVYTSELTDIDQKRIFQYLFINYSVDSVIYQYHDYFILLYQLGHKRFFENALYDKLHAIVDEFEATSNPSLSYLLYCYTSINYDWVDGAISYLGLSNDNVDGEEFVRDGVNIPLTNCTAINLFLLTLCPKMYLPVLEYGQFDDGIYNLLEACCFCYEDECYAQELSFAEIDNEYHNEERESLYKKIVLQFHIEQQYEFLKSTLSKYDSQKNIQQNQSFFRNF